MTLHTIEQVDVTGKTILLRVDFNVPLDKTTGAISDDTRIVKSLPSIELMLSRGAALIIISHLGRPEKKGAPALALNPDAAKNFARLSPSCQREYIAWVSQGKRPETRANRVRETVAALSQGLKWISRKQAL